MSYLRAFKASLEIFIASLVAPTTFSLSPTTFPTVASMSLLDASPTLKVGASSKHYSYFLGFGAFSDLGSTCFPFLPFIGKASLQVIASTPWSDKPAN